MGKIECKMADAGVQPEIRCGVCGNVASLKYKDHPGYREPARFDVMSCAHCDSSFAFPMEVDSNIYDLIYSDICKVPGYRRYYDYALEVLEQKNPLEYLSLNEEVYWSIDNFLQKFSISKKSLILEVGCGFGYLTYAIATSGYCITGLDISKEAVENATRRYGNHYICADLAQYVLSHRKQFDVVILTEIIEHIPDIVSFIRTLDDLVKDDGLIVLTTPNKSAYAAEVIWETELPPIHLWWLSRTAVEKIARQVGREAVFTDFSGYDKLKRLRQHRTLAGLPTKKSTFSADNELLLTESPRKKSLLSRTVKKVKSKLFGRLFRNVSRRKYDRVERDTLCAVLVKHTST